MLLEHLGQGEEVAQALAHLLAVNEQHARVHPGVGKTLVPGAGGLGALVLVMREGKVGAAAVNVDGRAQITVHHGGALGVPSGTALAPRALPGRLAGLGGLPQGKVQRVALVLVLLDAGTHHEVIDVAAGDLAVRGVAAHGEVHVAVVGRIGVTALDQRLDHADHGADLLGGTGAHIRVEHVGGAHDADELVGELGGDLLGGATLLVGAVDDLVIHVGEVLSERDLVAARDEPAADHVEADEGAGVADVDVVVDGGAAHVHADLALLNGTEVLFLVSGAVVDFHGYLLRGGAGHIIRAQTVLARTKRPQHASAHAETARGRYAPPRPHRCLPCIVYTSGQPCRSSDFLLVGQGDPLQRKRGIANRRGRFFQLHRSSRQTDQAPMPSPSPSQPSFSVVVALTPMFSTGQPMARARFSRMASRCGPILGS